MNSGARRHATREQIIAAEVRKLEQRQAIERAATNGASAPRPVARAQVFVDPWPEQAFEIFIKEAGFGFRTVHWSWLQPERDRYMRFRRGPMGRFAEVYDTVTDDGFEIGRVTAWQPGARLALVWREVDWPEGASTDVDVAFEPLFGGTLVTVEHSGFERLGPRGAQSAAQYQVAWIHALGWVAARARARGAAEVSR